MNTARLLIELELINVDSVFWLLQHIQLKKCYCFSVATVTCLTFVHSDLGVTSDLSAPSRPKDDITYSELKDAHWLYDTPGIMKEHDVSVCV